jgi:hypothetical protein
VAQLLVPRELRCLLNDSLVVVAAEVRHVLHARTVGLEALRGLAVLPHDLRHTATGGRLDELRVGLVVPRGKFSSPTVGAMEADILNVVPPRRLRRRLERLKPDPAAGVPLGDLGDPRPPLAMPHAVVAAGRVAPPALLCATVAVGAADGRRGTTAGRTCHFAAARWCFAQAGR